MQFLFLHIGFDTLNILKGGLYMDMVAEFVISLVASIVAAYIYDKIVKK